ncbi:MAG: 4Fe-4S dicluster domain-containing protein [Acholeplasmataceae bacterium]
MLTKTGYPSLDMILSKFPSQEQLVKPKAILECYEKIPCNPCVTSCPFDAISIADGLNDEPRLNADQCTGCGKCVIHCPGLSIMIAQLINHKAMFKIPYEFSPYPKKGEIWYGVNRNGDVICDAEIKSISVVKDVQTALVTVITDDKYIHDFVTIKPRG